MAKSVQYQLVFRTNHSTEIPGGDLYLWGGDQEGLPKVHENENKRSITMKVDVFSLSAFDWTKTATTGTPPAGVMNYGTAVIGQDMFVFGGRCDYSGKCCHNELYALNTNSKVWRKIPCTDGPMEKNSCGFISYSYQRADYLLALGGRAGKQPTQQQQQHSLCIPYYSSYYTNEIHTMEMSSSQGKWNVPIIKGERPPPLAGFTLDVLPNDRSKAILFGGFTLPSKYKSHPSADLYLLTLSNDTVEFIRLSRQSVSGSQWPEPRYHHSSTVIKSYIDSKEQSHLLVLGGTGTDLTIADCWIMNLSLNKWNKIDLPQTVCGRRALSLSSITMKRNTEWLIIIGGWGMDHSSIRISGVDVTAVVEIEYVSGQWVVRGVWNSTKKEELTERMKKLRPERKGRNEEEIERLTKQLSDSQPETRKSRSDSYQFIQQVREETRQAQQERRKVRSDSHQLIQQAQEETRNVRSDSHQLIQQAREETRQAQQEIRQAQQERRKVRSDSYQFIQQAREVTRQAQQETRKVRSDSHQLIQQAREETRQAQQETRKVRSDSHQLIQQAQEETRQAQQETRKVRSNSHQLIQQAREETRQAQEETRQAQLETRKVRSDSHQLIQRAHQETRQIRRELTEQVEQLTNRTDDLSKQIQQAYQTIQLKNNNLHTMEEQVRSLQNNLTVKDRIIRRNEVTIAEQQQEIRHYRDNPHWQIEREEVVMTEEVLGSGGWCEVKVGIFRGTRVAVKCLHQMIVSEYNLQLFSREMDIASRVRHPNLLQFIGATRVGNPIMLTELMPTSLRKELEKYPMTKLQVISIGIDITLALNYLHLWKPYPILHRDVSSANVLLEPSAWGKWKAKLSDYGSANLQEKVHTEGPGSPVYSAPEAKTPELHSPAMDIYSIGILLVEMATGQFPSSVSFEREAQIREVKWPLMKDLVYRCTDVDAKSRPSSKTLLNELRGL